MKTAFIIPNTDMIEKCGHRPQLVSWLDEARQELENVTQEINDAIGNGKNFQHPQDRRFFERMYRIKREKGKLIHQLNERLRQLKDEPSISFEEYFIEQLKNHLGPEIFNKILQNTRAAYQKDILGMQKDA